MPSDACTSNGKGGGIPCQGAAAAMEAEHDAATAITTMEDVADRSAAPSPIHRRL